MIFSQKQNHGLVFLAALLCAAILFSTPAFGQTAPKSDTLASTIAVTPLPPSAQESAIKAAQAGLSNEAGLTDEQAKEANDFYAAAIARHQTLRELQNKSAESKVLRANAQVTITRLESEIASAETALKDPMRVSDEPLTEESLLRFDQRIAELEAEAEGQRRGLEDIETRLSAANRVSTGGATSRADIRDRLSKDNEEISSFTIEATNPVEAARRALTYVRRAALEQEIETLLQREQAAPFRLRILPLERQLVQLRMANTDRELQALRQKTGAFRAQEISNRIRMARDENDAAQTMHPIVQKYAAENLQLAIDLKNIEAAGGPVPLVRSRLLAASRQITSDRELAESILRESDIGREYGAVLRQLRNNLPDIGRQRVEVSDRSKLRLSISMQRVLAQNRLQDFPASGINVAAIHAKWKLTNPEGAPLTAEDDSKLRELYKQERSLLTEFISAAGRQSSALSEVNVIQTTLVDETQGLVKLLDGKLIWLPSAEPISTAYPRDLSLAVRRLVSRDNISSLVKGTQTGLARSPIITLLLVILWALSFVTTPRLSSKIQNMGPLIGRVQTDKYSHTPIAILAGIVSAMRWAIPPFALGYILMNSGVFGFAPLAGAALIAVGGLIWGLDSLREWARPHALLERHFKVKPTFTLRLRRNLGWFIPIQVVAAFLVTTCSTVDGEASTAALGVLGFIFATLSIALLAYRILLADHVAVGKILKQDGFAARHRKGLFAAALIIPLIISVLAITGYFSTALEVQSRILLTAAVAATAYILYGLSHRTLMIARRRAKLVQLLEQREKAAAERKKRLEAEERGEDAPAAPLDYDKIDIEQMSRQSGQLLNLIIALGAAALIYILWASLLPALTIFDEIKLHSFDTGKVDEDGIKIITQLTLWSIMQAVAFTILTVIAVRNLPGLLELFVLQRTKLKESSRYAITTVTGYLIIIIGFLLAFNKLGLQWSSMKWIVGGLSVGIGFGLQEIIANFISGLIILFERPVRIGDYVTIGDQSGKVSRIQIRATTLTNLDNLEIVIPNKELITGRVTNWTLTTGMTRLAIPVGIAYGTDTKRAHDVMLETAKSNPNVLKTPEPKVLFMGFGDSALDFEVRVYLANFDSRVPMRHEMHMQLNEALSQAGITIPFPQRDLHIMSSSVDFTPQAKPKTQSKPKAPKGKSS